MNIDTIAEGARASVGLPQDGSSIELEPLPLTPAQRVAIMDAELELEQWHDRRLSDGPAWVSGLGR